MLENHIRAIAEAAASRVLFGSVIQSVQEVDTTDDTEQTIDVTPTEENCVGAITITWLATFPDGTERATAKRIYGYYKTDTTMGLTSSTILLTDYRSTGLTGTTWGFREETGTLIITFEGLAATDIKWQVRYSIEQFNYEIAAP